MSDLIKIDIEGLEKQEISNVTSNLNLAVERAFNLFSDDLEEDVKKEVPRKSGDLMESIKVSYGKGNINVESNKDYASIVREGRSSISGKLMVFKAGGRTIFTYKSKAVRGKDFVKKGFRKTEKRRDTYMKEALAMVM